MTPTAQAMDIGPTDTPTTGEPGQDLLPRIVDANGHEVHWDSLGDDWILETQSSVPVPFVRVLWSWQAHADVRGGPVDQEFSLERPLAWAIIAHVSDPGKFIYVFNSGSGFVGYCDHVDVFWVVFNDGSTSENGDGGFAFTQKASPLIEADVTAHGDCKSNAPSLPASVLGANRAGQITTPSQVQPQCLNAIHCPQVDKEERGTLSWTM